MTASPLFSSRLFGPRLDSKGTTFRLWAPGATSVDLVTTETQPMRRTNDGWYELRVPGAGAGTRYQFRIDDKLNVPDPVSAFQPDDVHGASEVIDNAYGWTAVDWRGRPWRETILLEIHVGTFTPEGTFRAVIDRLDDIVAEGFTAIELMPVADFFGRRNWGYDGVLLYAPDSTYGRPEDLKALVDAAHRRGLMVFLDVVYNHFGPEGNYLGLYAPTFFTDKVVTPWGPAIDYSVPEVRAFAIENALHWVADYRFDGLRLDAVHAVLRRGTPSILADIARAVGAFAEANGRLIHLVLENDDNAASLLDPTAPASRGLYRAQWNDDYHHMWHVLLTGETRSYYRDYAQAPRQHIVRALGSGFVYQGEPSKHRGGEPRGEPSGHLPPTAFVSFLQNHDQVGNRARGERLDRLASDPRGIEAALAVTLLAPMPPMLFMGEEWGADQPFPFFCDFPGDLGEAVREGRRREFREQYIAGDNVDEIPDPLADETFRSAVLDWSARSEPKHRRRLDLVKSLLATRHAHIIPRLSDAPEPGTAACNGTVLTAAWQLDSGRLNLLANLSAEPAHRTGECSGQPLWGGPAPEQLAPWAVHWAWDAR
jgi:maltooligosyltrehalose trehalohydrolase